MDNFFSLPISTAQPCAGILLATLTSSDMFALALSTSVLLSSDMSNFSTIWSCGTREMPSLLLSRWSGSLIWIADELSRGHLISGDLTTRRSHHGSIHGRLSLGPLDFRNLVLGKVRLLRSLLLWNFSCFVSHSTICWLSQIFVFQIFFILSDSLTHTWKTFVTVKYLVMRRLQNIGLRRKSSLTAGWT